MATCISSGCHEDSLRNPSPCDYFSRRLPATAVAQAEGAVAGAVSDAQSGLGLAQAQILVDDHTPGHHRHRWLYRVRGIRSGWHRVAARLIGYRSVVQRQRVRRGQRHCTLDFSLEPNPLQLDPLVVTAPVDPVLDPLATSTEQKISAADLRELPVSSLEEALALSAGSVGESYRGGGWARSRSSWTVSGSRISSTRQAADSASGFRPMS